MRDYPSLEDALQAVGDHRQELPFRCHVHEDHQASASVNVAKGLWVCYACHAGGRVDQTTVSYDVDRVKEDIFSMLDEEPARPLPESMFALYQPPHQYWRTRFSSEALQHFGFGTDPVTGQPTYPLRNPAGELLGMVRRQEEHPKYKYPAGVKAHQLLFNYSAGVRDQITLVEGAPDVLACWEVGVEAWGIYGSHLGEHQLELICKTSPFLVRLAFDNDAAGRLATEQATEMLLDVGISVLSVGWRRYPGLKDIAELSPGQRKAALGIKSA